MSDHNPQQYLNGEPWNEEEIEKRGRKLFEVARVVWPRPMDLSIAGHEISLQRIFWPSPAEQ